MNRNRYRTHDARIRGSLEHAVSEVQTSPAELQRLVDRARRAGVVVFLKPDLDRMPDISRALIETEHKRICERR